MKRKVIGISAAFALCSASWAMGADDARTEAGTCRQIAELTRKYDAGRVLSGDMAIEGRPCLRSEAADCLFGVLEKVLAQCRSGGKEALDPEERALILRLRDELDAELESRHGYHTLRDEVEAMLAKPDLYDYEYRIGVNGFVRGEGAGSFRLPDFSQAPGHAEGRFLYRVKPYLFWHPVAWLDLHAEGQGYGFSGGSQEYDKLSLYQGFAEILCPLRDGNSLKAGRQELVYGSSFMLGSDSFYKGLVYDALRLRITPLAPLTVDIFGGWYATPWSDGTEGGLAGGYAAWHISDGTGLEFYGFRDSGSAERHDGEHRNSFGVRATAKFGPVSCEVEPVWQTGRLFNGVDANESIRAWGGHADIMIDTDLGGIGNHFFAGAAYGSGSRDSALGVSGRKEFLNQATDSSLTGDMNVVGDLSGLDVGDYHASGLQIYTLGWGVDLTGDLSLTATGRYFLANYVPDGFSRRIGLETDFTLTYAISDALSIIAGYDRFFTGRFFSDASGSNDDIHYGYLMFQFDLSHTKPKKSLSK
ncbi:MULTISPECIES: alginate export family protein [Geobacter]|uniref:alginate export family protein n=1 Tax=Geobacter TaxID=28231 RepID=UPI002573F7E9|nr:alginate export family protein [Geobacter sulfurreducens]BEH10729.1 alginate export family protein [Geobacter sulfurreducens subsp. ethanolicus]BET58574.1 alginate export family protein [Geobacter sp. 60473]